MINSSINKHSSKTVGLTDSVSIKLHCATIAHHMMVFSHMAYFVFLFLIKPSPHSWFAPHNAFGFGISILIRYFWQMYSMLTIKLFSKQTAITYPVESNMFISLRHSSSAYVWCSQSRKKHVTTLDHFFLLSSYFSFMILHLFSTCCHRSDNTDLQNKWTLDGDSKQIKTFF